jgi:hypothetical protein
VPDIFISYSRADRPRAETIVEALRAEGFSLWWDADLRPGESYDEVTEENLRNAGAVIVLWSKTSVKSKWVRAEATMGERHCVLAPVLIEACDRPLRFELMQTEDLTTWSGDRTDRNWRSLVRAVNIALGREAPLQDADVHASRERPPEAASRHADETIESTFWSTIHDTDEPAELQAYLKRYPGGEFRALAEARLASLSKKASSEVNARASIPAPLIATAIFSASLIVGILMMLFASMIGIGSFTWTPVAGAELLYAGSKQVGYFSAINWSASTLVLMPIAWTMIFLALTEPRKAFAEMARRRMLVTTDFAPVTAEHPGLTHLQRHIRLFLIGGMAIITVIMVGLAMADHAQVAGQFYGAPGETNKLDRIDAVGFALETPTIERDWMVASFLTSRTQEPVGIGANNAFSLTAYILYVGLGIGSLLSFGLVMIGVGAAFMRGIAQNYGLQIIPDLQSPNPRRGFEVIRRFFAYAIAIAFIGCIMIYLMGIQNMYLRSPDASIFSFLTPNLSATDAGSFADRLDGAVGFLFSENVAKGTRNTYGFIFGFFIFAVFVGGFLFFLRQGVVLGGAAVRAELERNGVARLSGLTDQSLDTIKGRVTGIRIWPLDRPSFGMSLVIMLLMIASVIFYKLGALIVSLLGVALFYTLWKKSEEADTG